MALGVSIHKLATFTSSIYDILQTTITDSPINRSHAYPIITCALVCSCSTILLRVPGVRGPVEGRRTSTAILLYGGRARGSNDVSIYGDAWVTRGGWTCGARIGHILPGPRSPRSRRRTVNNQKSALPQRHVPRVGLCLVIACALRKAPRSEDDEPVVLLLRIQQTAPTEGVDNVIEGVRDVMRRLELWVISISRISELTSYQRCTGFANVCTFVAATYL